MSYYTSNYYSSNYYTSNYYNNSAGGVVFLSDNYYDKLGELGYEGSLSVRQMNYLGDLGYSGCVSERKIAHLNNLGYTGNCMSRKLKEKADAEGYISVSEMMVRTGMIPE